MEPLIVPRRQERFATDGQSSGTPRNHRQRLEDWRRDPVEHERPPMKAVDANLLELLKKTTQFVVPIYQRVYSWEASECERLWDDIVQTGKHDSMGAHFTGSIVYVERDQGTRTSEEPDLIIDGQQRVTTVTLLLAAVADRLAQLPSEEQEPVEGFSPKKIRGLYLTNEYEEGDRYLKLILSQADKEALKAIIRDAPMPSAVSRVVRNYAFFVAKLADPRADIVSVCIGLRKLVVVDVRLTRGADQPQLVFEALNSTGRRLSQADLIRNFVLMDLPPRQQTRLYEDYWFPMEQDFTGENEARFDEFVRHYLTLKTGSIPRLGDIYDAFKEYAASLEAIGTSREQQVVDLHLHAMWFAAMALGKEPKPLLARSFAEIEQIRASVVYPFFLRLYADYYAGTINEDAFLSLLASVTSYLFRRAVCRIPTNTLNKTFAVFARAVDPARYVESVSARFLTFTGNQRFPNDEEFRDSLCSEDLYHFPRAAYFFRKLENQGRKEEVSTADYSIEHIMPQNPNLSTEWREALGDGWDDVHDRLLHTLGKLTLTGYNPEYSDRPFQEKRDMEGGFRQSPLRLNQGFSQLEAWNETEIGKRGARLAELAIAIWPRPSLGEEVLAVYRKKFTESTGFDWSLAHDILAAIPDGRWTGYYYLADAIGTSAQAVAGHISKCPICVHPYRVLTWDGRVAEGFAWADPQDQRDPRFVLEEEGVRFTNGMADTEQKLLAEALVALVEEQP
jgi:uncharacterized protein with ParB-like and HNH nuclease domain/alkylated DNA nucleotide flippase Atl1